MKIEKDLYKGIFAGFMFMLFIFCANLIIATNSHNTFEILEGNFSGNYILDGSFSIENPVNISLSEGIGGGIPGIIISSNLAAIPNGWLECDGRILNISDYTNLYNTIGATYGGDNITTFALPDLRGEFIRGFDNGRGVDGGRALGSFQDHQFEIHTHSVSENVHTRSYVYSGKWGTSGRPWTATATVTVGNPNSGNHGNETRPRNFAMRYIIKT